MQTHWSQFVPSMSSRHPRTLSSTSSRSAGATVGKSMPAPKSVSKGPCVVAGSTDGVLRGPGALPLGVWRHALAGAHRRAGKRPGPLFETPERVPV